MVYNLLAIFLYWICFEILFFYKIKVLSCIVACISWLGSNKTCQHLLDTTWLIDTEDLESRKCANMY